MAPPKGATLGHHPRAPPKGAARPCSHLQGDASLRSGLAAAPEGRRSHSAAELADGGPSSLSVPGGSSRRSATPPPPPSLAEEASEVVESELLLRTCKPMRGSAPTPPLLGDALPERQRAGEEEGGRVLPPLLEGAAVDKGVSRAGLCISAHIADQHYAQIQRVAFIHQSLRHTELM